ncbi:MAG TPA: hypothetical protein VMM93_13240 [Vicinamibacterales bacterium]|nr:hypothetical protein [Vicinamibacterales bacterium]
MKKAAIIGLMTAFTLVAATPAAAQALRNDTSYDKEFGVKYSILNEEGTWANVGLLLDGGVKVCEVGTWSCSIIGELAFNRFSDFDATYTTYQAGVRLGKVVDSKMRPYVQFLLGGQACCGGENAFVITPGAGLNYAMTEAVDFQVQVDLPQARYFGDWFSQFRLSFGVGIPFGNR